MNFDRTKSKYCAFFCEENIWHLAKEFAAVGSVEKWFVLFFLCADPTSSFFVIKNQRAFGSSLLGFWDYHVVLFDSNDRLIYDLDSSLSCPLSTRLYFAQTFPKQELLAPGVRAMVRNIPLGEYLSRFSSDRSHMLDERGEALETFPKWPPIIADDPIWLNQYRSVVGIDKSQSNLAAVEKFAQDVV